MGMSAFLFLTVMSGAFVAGNDAGLVYNTYPMMADRVQCANLILNLMREIIELDLTIGDFNVFDFHTELSLVSIRLFSSIYDKRSKFV